MPSKKSLFIIISVGVIIEIAIVYLYLMPIINNYQVSKDSLDRALAESTGTQSKISEYTKILEKKQDIGQTAQKISSLMPSSPKTGDFMLELDDLAKSSNLTIPSITISEKTATAPAKPTSADSEDETAKSTSSSNKSTESSLGAQTLSFQTSISGSYWDFMNFLAKLQSSKRLNIIPTLSLTPSDDKVSVALTGDIYYLKDSNSDSTEPIELDNLEIVDKLSTFKAIKKPSEQGLDGRDNPFLPLQ